MILVSEENLRGYLTDFATDIRRNVRLEDDEQNPEYDTDDLIDMIITECKKYENSS